MSLRLNNDSDELQETHEINMTPFIDVMLVLLIIFMVAAPLSTVDIKIDLPDANAAPEPRPDKPLYLSLREDQQLFLDDRPIRQEQLGAELDQRTQANKDTTVFLRADKTVAYADLMTLMNSLREAGYLKIGLVGLEAKGTQ
jgi:biopolymer transport protein ExbD